MQLSGVLQGIISEDTKEPVGSPSIAENEGGLRNA